MVKTKIFIIGAIKKRIYHRSVLYGDQVIVFGGTKDSNIYSLNFRLVPERKAELDSAATKIDSKDLEINIEQNEFKQFKVVDSQTSTLNIKQRDKQKKDIVFFGEEYKFEDKK